MTGPITRAISEGTLKAAVCDLVADGLSTREIRRRTGASYGYIENLRRENDVRYRTLRVAVRCPGCGNKILTHPCRICRARNSP